MSGNSTQEPPADEPYWKTTLRPFVLSFKNQCNIHAYEAGIEACLATYLITRFALKKPKHALNASMAALFIVPLVTWPICMVMKKAEELTPKEL